MTLDGLLSVEEVADLLGIARSTVAERARRGDLPHIKLPRARRLMFPRADLEAYLAGAKLETRHLEGGGRLVTPAKRRGS